MARATSRGGGADRDLTPAVLGAEDLRPDPPEDPAGGASRSSYRTTDDGVHRDGLGARGARRRQRLVVR